MNYLNISQSGNTKIINNQPKLEVYLDIEMDETLSNCLYPYYIDKSYMSITYGTINGMVPIILNPDTTTVATNQMKMGGNPDDWKMRIDNTGVGKWILLYGEKTTT